MAGEKNFENKIKSYLDKIGAWYVKYWAGSHFTKSGVPDILACVNGYFVAIEVKAQNGVASELQVHTIKQIRKTGGFSMIVYPSGWNELKKCLDALNHGNVPNIDDIVIIFK